MRVDPVCCCLLLAFATGACADGGSPSTTVGSAASVIDDSAPAPDGSPRVVFYPRIGSNTDDMWGSIGPGVVLMNGGLTPISAFTWMHDTVDRVRIAGDVVVLCTKGDDVYSEAVYGLAPFNSVQTVLVPKAAPASDFDLVASRLKTAEIVFLADSAAANYDAWVGTSLGDAMLGVYDRGGVIAGSGAGAAALARAVLTTQTTSAIALANPYDPSITLTRGAFPLPLLAGVYVDLGLESGDRLGVLAAMTARAMSDGILDTTERPAMGIGLDANAALAFDYLGNATLLADDGAAGAAWIVHGSNAPQLVAGQPLVWPSAEMTRFDAMSEELSLGSDCGTAFSYDVAIDGSMPSPFTPADPYEAQGTSTPCAH